MRKHWPVVAMGVSVACLLAIIVITLTVVAIQNSISRDVIFTLGVWAMGLFIASAASAALAITFWRPKMAFTPDAVHARRTP